MPMGGLGQRFRAVGVDTPKPLIEVDGQPMFRRALDSFRDAPFDTRFITIIRDEDDRRHRIGAAVLATLPDARIIRITENTRGAVETVLQARQALDPRQPLVVLDCDIAFESDTYFNTIRDAARGSADGVLLSFPSDDPRYSFARVGITGEVMETAEKKAISNHALMGSYFFTRAGDFLRAADELMAENISAAMPEFYVSLIFNIMLAQGKRIELAVGTFYCFGTPEELAAYQRTGEPTARA